ncbi:MAG: hypothetical protein KatS3mg082_1557 [Nitrospiraceae bacterium]|nr:MAG: hypothetical protein KatS3mg082_1557 [Nitrospiraceae bacterium]
MVDVGWDVSGKSLVASAVNERKPRVFEGEQPASRVGLRTLMRAVGAGATLVVFEAGNQLKWVAETVKKRADVQVPVVHPTEGKGIPAHRGKTDRVDAKKLAELARAGLWPRAVHVGEGPGRARREVVSARQQLQSKRIALITTIRGSVDQEGHRLPEQCFAGPTWRAKLARLPLSAPLKLIIETVLASIAALASRGTAAHGPAVGDEGSPVRPAGDDPRHWPAVGLGAVLVGALDDVPRVDDQQAVAHDGALTPTIDQSGAVRQVGRINRDGRLEIRRVLLPWAQTVARMHSQGAKPLQQFVARIARRRGRRRMAVIALARKLLTTASGVLKSGQPYDPRKVQPATA